MSWLSTFKAFVVIRYKQELEYKGSFLAASFSQMLSYGADFLLLWILVNRFQDLAGWSKDEIIFLYAMQLMSYAIAGTFFFNSSMSLSRRIQSGEFDSSLTLPMHPLLYEVMSNYNAIYIRHLLLALFVFAVSFSNLGITLTPLKILLLIVFILGGALIQGGFLLMFSAPSFWMVRGDRLVSLFFFELVNFVRYPISIFPAVLKFGLTFVLPYAFINYYPSHYLLNKKGAWAITTWLQFLTPLVGILVFTFAVRFWNWNLQKYQSTGT